MDQNDYQHVTDDGHTARYFHFMLNMADDDLDPYQYRLLGHYRRVCGLGGICTEGTRKTAQKCKMSAGKVSTTRRELEQLGYVRLHDTDDGIHVTLVDRMAENIARYARSSCSEQGVHPVNGVFTTRTNRSSGERGRSASEPGCSPGERKNQQDQNQPENQPTKNQPSSESPQTPEEHPAWSEDDEWLKKTLAETFGLAGEYGEQLLARSPDEAAALAVRALKIGRKPPHLLITMLQKDQPASEDDLVLARIARELKTLDLAKIDRELRGRELADFSQQVQERIAQAGTETPRRPAAAAPEPGETGAALWAQIRRELAVKLAGQDTAAALLVRQAQAVGLEGGQLTITAGDVDRLTQHRETLNRLASRIAGQPLEVIVQ